MYEVYDKEETKQFIKFKFDEIDRQLNCSHKASITFSHDFFEDAKRDKFIHWWLVGEILKEKYGYVTMERFNEKNESIEASLNSYMTSFLSPEINVKYFKFYIYNDRQTYRLDADGYISYNQRFDIFDEQSDRKEKHESVEDNHEIQTKHKEIKTFEDNDYHKDEDDKAFGKMIKQMRTNVFRSSCFNVINNARH